MSARVELTIRHPLDRFVLEVDLDVECDSLAVFGPSGSGKTTLVEMIAGWRRPQHGTIRLGGIPYFESATGLERMKDERRIGYVPQDLLLFSHLDVERNIRSGEGRARAPASCAATFERVVSVLELGDLLHRPVDAISGGERQRVALARALCSDPDLLLLDEPFGGVDVDLRRRILPFLLRLRDSFAIPLIFISHDATEVQALCDQIVVLDRGRIVARGPTTRTLFRTASQAAQFDNLLSGTILATHGATQSVRLGAGLEKGLEIRVARTELSPGSAVRIALAADDILLASEAPHGLSARNCIAARVVALRALEHHVVVEVSVLGLAIFVSVTPDAVTELAVHPERPIWLVFKSSSCRALDRA